MTALSINVSTQDTVHGWESLRPTTISTEKREYLEALHESQELDRLCSRYIDEWLIDHDDAKLQEFQDDCVAAQKRLHAAWLRLEASYSRTVVVQVGAEVES